MGLMPFNSKIQYPPIANRQTEINAKRPGSDMQEHDAKRQKQDQAEDNKENREDSSVIAQNYITLANSKVKVAKTMSSQAKLKATSEYMTQLRNIGIELANNFITQQQGYLNQTVQFNTIQKDLDVKREQLSSIQSEHSNLKSEVQTFTNKLELKEHLAKTQQEELSSLREKQKIFDQQVSELQKKSKELEISHGVQQSELNHQKDQTSIWKEHYENVNQDKQSLQTDLGAANSKLERSNQELQEVKAKLVQAQKDVALLTQRVEHQGERVTDQTQEKVGLSKELEMLRAEKLDLSARISAAETKSAAEAKAHILEVEDLQQQLAKKENLVSHISNQAEVVDGMGSELTMLRQQRDTSQELLRQKKNENEELKAKVQSLSVSLEQAELKILDGETLRRKLHNTIQELKGNIRVFARIRPATHNDSNAGNNTKDQVFKFVDTDNSEGQEGLQITVPSRDSTNSTPALHNFNFDKVFQPAATQDTVFEDISQLVQSALDGYKVCIFAYGQTGSGKTHTMMGSQNQTGMIPRAIQQVFNTSEKLAKSGWSYNMTCTMVEIYNEELKDLLSPGNNNKQHKIIHDQSKGTVITDITPQQVNTPSEIEQLLSKAMRQRAVAQTAVNDRSSRSHMVFSLKIHGSNSNTQQEVQGLLHLIDLAGSERVKDSGVQGQRLKETQHINKSLTALGDVISALSQSKEHIPYRNSKLTYLLQQSLGGNAKTLMFVNLSPVLECAGESLCSLRFASKVNNCQIGVAKKQIVK